MLSSRRGSKSSSLPGSGVLACAPVRLPLLFSSWHVLAPAVGRSGMNRATMKAASTVHAPSRKGGPGIATRWQTKNRQSVRAGFSDETDGWLTRASRLAHNHFLAYNNVIAMWPGFFWMLILTLNIVTNIFVPKRLALFVLFE